MCVVPPVKREWQGGGAVSEFPAIERLLRRAEFVAPGFGTETGIDSSNCPEGLGLRVEPHRGCAAAAERIVQDEIDRVDAGRSYRSTDPLA